MVTKSSEEFLRKLHQPNLLEHIVQPPDPHHAVAAVSQQLVSWAAVHLEGDEELLALGLVKAKAAD